MNSKNYINPFRIFIYFHLIVFIILVFSCKTPAIIATQTIQMADEYNNAGNYNKAINHYKKYLQISPSLGIYRNPSMEADVYRKLAHAYSTKLQYDSSIYCIEKALKIDSTPPVNKLAIIEDYRMLGITNGYIGDYNQSIKHLNQSLEINKGMDKSIKEVRKLSIADTHLSLARVQYVIGKLSEAEFNVNKAIELYQTITNEYLGLTESYLLLGKIRLQRNDKETGFSYIIKSRKIADKNNINTARHFLAIGSAYMENNEYDEALRSRLEALKRANETGIIPQIVWANVKIGDAYSYIGDEEKAEIYYKTAFTKGANGSQQNAISPSLNMRLGDVQAAYSTFSKSGSLMGTAISCLRLGEINEKKESLNDAISFFQQADSLFNIIKSNEGEANAKLAICRILINKNQLAEAKKLIQEAEKLSKNLETKWKLLFEQGRIFEQKAQINPAYKAYAEAIKIIEEIRGKLDVEEFRSAYITDKTHVYERMIMLLIKKSQKGAFKELDPAPEIIALNYSERAKSRAFLDLLGNSKIPPKNIKDSTLLNKEYNLKVQIQQISKEIQKRDMAFEETGELESYLEQLRAEYKKLIDIIKLSNKSYNSLISVIPPKTKDIQKLLSKNDAIIEYWIGKEASVVWIISNDNITTKILNIKEPELTKLVSDCRNSIKFGDEIYKKQLKELYNELCLPIKKTLFKYQSLYIVPHKSLHFLPFQALIDEKGKFLIEYFNISYAPSSAILELCSLKKLEQENDFLGMALGNNVIGNASALPGTKIEVNQIMQLYSTSTTKNEKENSETTFKNIAPKHNILHIATHGFLDSDYPLNSYLLMEPDSQNDGKLSVSEIFELNLNSKLITLSACESGLGELSSGDEIVGLSRAFIYAGTPAVVASLWPVDDASTALLMTRLHQYYAAGYTIQNALSLAQRDLIKNNFTKSVKRGQTSTVNWHKALAYEINKGNKAKKANPYYWAPFILIGFGGK